MDGLIFSNHQPSPALIEYKKAIEPVFVVSGGLSEVKIVNRYDTISLDHLKCVWSLIGDGFQSSEKDVSIPIGILPSHETTIHLPNLDTSHLRTESYLQLRFLLKEPAIWGPKDHEVAWDQINIVAATKLKQSLSPPNHPPAIEKTKTSLKISGISSTWEINLISGTLSSWKKESFELIHAGPIMDFYRAPTDNDSPGPQTDNLSPSDGANWRQKRLHQTKEALRLITWGVQDDLAIVTVQKRVAPPVLEWSIDTKTTYTFNNSSVLIKVNGVPQGINLPTTLARIGLTMSLNPEITTASWFGRGPGESYRDKKLSQRFGNWTSSIDDLFTDYEYPQESANRTDIRWVALSGLETAKTVNTLKASFGNQVGCSFMASHYKTDAIEKAKHPYELHKEARPEVVLRLDWQHHGLGTGSCGPKTMEKYSLFTKPFQYEVLLE
jgi:beta-galactosidase